MDGYGINLINDLLSKLHLSKSIDKRCELSEKLLLEVRSFKGSLNSCQDLSRSKLLTVAESMLDSMSVKLVAIGLDLLLLLDKHLHESKAMSKLYHAGLSKLGDSKAQVREFAKRTMKEICTFATTRPNSAFDMPSLMLNFGKASRNWQIRQLILEILHDICSCTEFKEYVSSQSFSNLLPAIIGFLLDANSQVRDESASFLMDVSEYHFKLIVKHVKTEKIPLQRIKTLLPTVHRELNSELILSSNSIVKTTSESSRSITSAVVTEEDLSSIWDVHIRFKGYTLKEAKTEVSSISDCLKNPNEEWDLKMQKLQKLRGLVAKLTETNSKETVSIMLKEVQFSLSLVAKDLRSQLCKEACATISFISFKIGDEFCHIFEHIIRVLIPIFHSSIRVISSSTFSCVSLCVKNTVAPRIIPIIIQNYDTNRSKEIRRRCMELINMILEAWSESSWKNYVIQLSKMIHSGLIDADGDTRNVARSIFWFIADIMKPMADNIFNRLDNSRKKLIIQTKPEGYTGSFTSETQRIPSPGFYRRAISNVYRLNTSNSLFATPVHSDVQGHPIAKSSTIDRHLELGEFKSGTQNYKIESVVEPLKHDNSSTNQFNAKSTSVLVKPTRIDVDGILEASNVITTKVVYNDANRTNYESLPKHATEDHLDTDRTTEKILPKPILSNISVEESASVRDSELWDRSLTGMGRHSDTIRVYSSDDSMLDQRTAILGPPGSTPYSRTFSVNLGKREIKPVIKMAAGNNDLLTPLGKALASLAVVGDDEVHESLRKLRTVLFERNSLTLLQTIEIRKALLGYLDKSLLDDIKITCLEALIYFIAQHGQDQGDFMHELIPLVFENHSKSKSEVLKKKVLMLLETVRDSVPSQKQLAAILKYLSRNPDLEPSTKSLILQMINVLLMICDGSGFYKTKEFPETVTVLINWAMDLRNTTLRKESSQMILAISQLCPSQFHKVITSMSLNQQNYVATIIRKNFKLEVVDSSESNPTDKNEAHDHKIFKIFKRESEDSFKSDGALY